jgi:serine/threonine protein kinase
MSGQHNLVGQALAGRYKLVKMIGQGGMGSVYQASDLQMSNRVVAVKVLAPHLVSDEKQVLRFEQEARAANQLRHPNTISVLDFGQADGHIFMVIEFLTGDTLTNVMRKGRLDLWRSLYMMRQICKSLAEAHSKGIIHRDLKPDNIFVCEIYGEKDFIKVIDFGIAKFLEAGGQELTQAGKMFGTPRYLSPEQAQGLPLSAASDLYSLGVILFEMVSGRPPFVAEDPIAVAIKHVQEAPPSFAEVAPEVHVPPEVDTLVFKLLAKKALQRYQSAEEVLEAIDSVMSGQGGRNPSGQFAPLANMTPSRPKTIPPTSNNQGRRGTVPPPSLSKNNDEVEATRALDAADFQLTGGGGGEAAPTMAMDSVAHLMPAAAERTLALDSDAAKAAIAAAAKKSAPDLKNPKAPAKDSGGGGVRNVLIIALVVIAVGAVAAATFLPKSEPKVQALAALPAPEKPPEPVKEPEKPAEPVKPIEVAKPVEPAKPVEKTVPIVSTPPGAQVTLEGTTLGVTPFDLKIKAGMPNQKILLKLTDFEDYELETEKIAKAVELGATNIPATLKAKPKAAPKAQVSKGTGGGKKPKLEW